MTKPKKTPKAPERDQTNEVVISDSTVTALDHYQREKGKRAKRDVPDDERMEAARREYKALLEAQAAKGKGGRPKKNAAPAGSDASSDPDAGEE